MEDLENLAHLEAAAPFTGGKTGSVFLDHHTLKAKLEIQVFRQNLF